MDETSAPQQPPTIETQITSDESNTDTSSHSQQYWCYQCDKRVAVDTLADLPDVICHECKNGFVESIATRPLPDPIDEPSFGNQFLQVLRLIAQVARDDDSPPPPPPPPQQPDPSDDDYLRIEFGRWDNDDDINDDDDDVRPQNVDDVQRDEDEEREEEEEESRRRRRDVLRLRLSDFATRASRNRVLDWADILMGLEDHSIELRLQVPGMDDYAGNPGDYVDAAAYEALLQNFAESDSNGRRGAPPAAKSAVMGLENVKIISGGGDEGGLVVCAICKDSMSVGEVGKKLPCGHVYHGECIVPWLGSRNSCPVCRFELATDDPEYEEERKKRALMGNVGGGGGGGASSSSVSGGYNNVFD